MALFARLFVDGFRNKDIGSEYYDAFKEDIIEARGGQAPDAQVGVVLTWHHGPYVLCMSYTALLFPPPCRSTWKACKRFELKHSGMTHTPAACKQQACMARAMCVHVRVALPRCRLLLTCMLSKATLEHHRLSISTFQSQSVEQGFWACLLNAEAARNFIDKQVKAGPGHLRPLHQRIHREAVGGVLAHNAGSIQAAD